MVRQTGLQLIRLLIEEEVKRLVGRGSDHRRSAPPTRWRSEHGYCVVIGQKVPVERPRLRSTDDREIRLGSYEMFHRGEALTETYGKNSCSA
jgi:putative transposase